MAETMIMAAQALATARAPARSTATTASKVLKSVVVEVTATDDWQDTGVQVQKGQTLEIEYLSGVWHSWPGAYCSAGGYPDTRFNCCSVDFAICGLIGYLGSQSPFGVGSHKSFVVPVDGRLSLRMNDSDRRDNSGSIQVRIRVLEP